MAGKTLEASTYRLSGRSYGPSTTTTAGTKRYIFVKLTDSAIKAIEEYQSCKEKKQAEIQIGEERGHIQLGGDTLLNFVVADNAITDGPQGSFECIQQKVRKGEVEYLGDIKQKITVNATEDSFSNTRQKMAMAKEESEKQCAKEIKSSSTGPNIGNRVKVKRGADPSAMITSNKKLRAEINGSSPVNQPFANRKKPSTTQPAIKPATSYPTKPSTAVSGPPVPSSRPNTTLGVPESTTPANSSRSPLAVRSPVAPAGAPQRPLRERVIHTLALKSMGKVDFLKKLSQFGYKEEDRLDRLQVDNLLAEVSSFKEGRYDLLPSLFSEVDPKWLPYNPSEQMMLAKRLSTMENNRPSATLATVMNNASTKSATVGAANTTVASLNVINGKSSGGSFGKSAGDNSNTVKGKSESAERLQSQLTRALLEHPNPGDDLSPPPSSSSTCSTPSPPDHSKLKEIGNRNSTKQVGTAVHRNDVFGSLDDQMGNSNPDKEDNHDSVEIRYRPIKTSDQRRQYKRDFYAEYKEYKELHEQMASISGRFSDLESKFRQQKSGTPDYRAIARSIKEEYFRLKNDEDYKKKRKRWEHLTSKLTSIKQQIKSYDAEQGKATLV